MISVPPKSMDDITQAVHIDDAPGSESHDIAMTNAENNELYNYKRV